MATEVKFKRNTLEAIKQTPVEDGSVLFSTNTTDIFMDVGTKRKTYNSETLTIDDTLTQSGKAADAKAVGDALKGVPEINDSEESEVDTWSSKKIVGEIEEVKSNIIVDKKGNLYDTVMIGVRTVESGSALQMYTISGEPNNRMRTAIIKVSPNTAYTVIFSKQTDYCVISTGSNKINEDLLKKSPNMKVDIQNVRVITTAYKSFFNFITDENAEYLYICSTISGQIDAYIYVCDGTTEEIKYPTSWVKNLDAYNREEIDKKFDSLLDAKNISVIPESNKIKVYFKIKNNIYGEIDVSHEINHNDDIYVDYWRINDSYLCTSEDGISFERTGEKLLIGAENEMAVEFIGMGDYTGGWHGDERIDLDNNNYVTFIVDGIEYEIDDLVKLGELRCETFEYRILSRLYASYSYNSNHQSIAKHVKRTIFKGSKIETENYIEMDFSNTDIENLTMKTSFTGLFCVATPFALKCVSDVGKIYIGNHPETTVTLISKANKYSRKVKMFNGDKSCIMDSMLINTNITDLESKNVIVDIMDRQQDLKYYSYLPSNIEVKTGDYFATKSEIDFNM